jgi:hypothetical protein
MGVRALDQMPEVAFCPTSATEFTTFSLREAAGVRMKFAGEAMRITGEGGEMVAKRVSH